MSATSSVSRDLKINVFFIPAYFSYLCACTGGMELPLLCPAPVRSGLLRGEGGFRERGAGATHSRKRSVWGKCKGDGACMFRALSWHLFETEGEHVGVRGTLLHFIMENADWYTDFLDDGVSMAEYLDMMSDIEAWGDALVLQAAADCYSARIRIHKFKVNEYGMETTGQNFVLMPRYGAIASVWGLLYEEDVHYDAVHFSKRCEIVPTETQRGGESPAVPMGADALMLDDLLNTLMLPGEPPVLNSGRSTAVTPAVTPYDPLGLRDVVS